MTSTKTTTRHALGALQIAIMVPLVLLLATMLAAVIQAAPFVVAPAHHHQAPPAAESCYGALTNYGC